MAVISSVGRLPECSLFEALMGYERYLIESSMSQIQPAGRFGKVLSMMAEEAETSLRPIYS
jgi:hypothetical protein